MLEVLRSGQLSLGPRPGVRAGVRRPARRAARQRGVERHRRAAPGAAGVGVSDGDEVITSPFSFVASANVAVYERARPVFADIDPVTLNLDPDAAARGRHRAHRGPAAGPRVRLPGRHRRVRAARPADRRGRLRGARGGPRRRARRSAARGHPAVFGFYANKQLTTGEGGMVTMADAALKERIDSERNQGRAPDMGWLDHDRLGFNYRLSDIACALGTRPARAARRDARRPRPRSPRCTARRWRGSGPRAAVPGCGRQPPRLVRVRRAAAAAHRPRRTVVRCASAGIPSKPYLPAIHLMSYYRERFGHREGEFPVCEDVAARSIALPFFPEMTEGQVERVAAALR